MVNLTSIASATHKLQQPKCESHFEELETDFLCTKCIWLR